MLKRMRKKSHRKSAFSLIEMSIVLLIVSIIISGMLTVSTVAINNEKVRITKERMDEIYKALGRFMLKSYRLPCPASLTLTKTQVAYGAEIGTAGVCSGSGVYTSSTLSALPVYGMVPTAALGLADKFAEDGFGSKFAYVVHQYYTKTEYSTAASSNGFSYLAPNTVTMPAIISMPSAVANDYNAFVIISFGANKYGAFNAGSSTQNSSSGASTYELQNMLTSISGSSAAFGVNSSHDSTITFTTSDADSETFDDIVFAKKRTEMIADFAGEFLVPCASPGSGYSSVYYGQSQYRTTACSAPNASITPSVECGILGTSITKISCP